MYDYEKRLDYIRAVLIERRIARGDDVPDVDRHWLRVQHALGHYADILYWHRLCGDDFLLAPLEPVYGPVQFAEIVAEFLADDARQGDAIRNPSSHCGRQSASDEQTMHGLDQGRG